MLQMKNLLIVLAVFSICLPLTYCAEAQDKPAVKEAPLSAFAASMITDKALAEATRQLDQQTHAPASEIEKFAAGELLRFGLALGILQQEMENVRVSDHGTFALAMTEKWVYHVDVAGNQTFRPVSNLPQLANPSCYPMVSKQTSIV